MGIGKGYIRKYFASVNDQAPFLAYLGTAFWSAWILTTSGVRDQFTLSIGAGSLSSLTYLETRLVTLVVLILFAVFCRRSESIIIHAKALIVVAIFSVMGNVLLVISWSGITNNSLVLHAGCLLVGVGLAAVLLRAGIMYSHLSPWRAMLLFMTSQLIAACLYLIIVVSPLEVSLCLFCSLPLCAAAMFSLHSAENSPEKEATEGPVFTAAFIKFVFLILVFRFASNLGKIFLVSIKSDEMLGIGIVGNILLKMLIALIFIAYAFKPNKKVNYGRVCYFVFAATTVVLAVLPLFEEHAPLLYALNGALSGLTGNIAFCMLAYICFQSGASPIRVFGIGYSAVFLGSSLGYYAGDVLAPLVATNQIPGVMFIGAAYLLLLIAFVVAPPKIIDRLILPVPDEDNFDELTIVKPDKGRRDGWDEKCKAIGESYQLTVRELEVMELLALGRGYQYVSDTLGISINTIRTHARSIYAKLGVHSRAELIACIDKGNLL